MVTVVIVVVDDGSEIDNRVIVVNMQISDRPRGVTFVE